MPIIMHQHPGDWTPSLPWPDDCQVQWGASGLVIGRSGARRTAFFEAFPADGAGGFIRGEGSSLDDAEKHAFDRWKRQHECFITGGHRWGRTRRLKEGKTTTYTNGGAYCLKCGAFETALKPIVTLGGWRAPLCSSELSLISMGAARPDDSARKTIQSARALELRAKMYGIDIPDWRDSIFATKKEWPDTDPYEDACSVAVAKFYAKHYLDYQARPLGDSLFASVMSGLAIREIHDRAVELGLIDGDDQ